MSDLAVTAFLALRSAFFDEAGEPREFDLRDKQNTMDDPLDVLIWETLRDASADDVKCVRANGPLISPDMAMVRPDRVRMLSRSELENDTTAVVAIEVKKVERSSNGRVSRGSGMDYNSTPPCGKIRVYDEPRGKFVDVPGFYLFVCLERGSRLGAYKLTALVLCDGHALNSDFKYYIDITGERTKDVGVGTYGDGANRKRPMVIFANPLGSEVFEKTITLIHRSPDLASNELVNVGSMRRTAVASGEQIAFSCYRRPGDLDETIDLLDPFLQAKNRSEKTAGRGQFSLGVKVRG